MCRLSHSNQNLIFLSNFCCKYLEGYIFKTCKDFFQSFPEDIYLEEGREREREKSISCLPHAPTIDRTHLLVQARRSGPQPPARAGRRHIVERDAFSPSQHMSSWLRCSVNAVTAEEEVG